MQIISSRTDIETYVSNDQPDFVGDDKARLVEAIQDADHPAYGADWVPWLDQHIDALRSDVASAAATAEVVRRTARRA